MDKNEEKDEGQEFKWILYFSTCKGKNLGNCKACFLKTSFQCALISVRNSPMLQLFLGHHKASPSHTVPSVRLYSGPAVLKISFCILGISPHPVCTYFLHLFKQLWLLSDIKLYFIPSDLGNLKIHHFYHVTVWHRGEENGK